MFTKKRLTLPTPRDGGKVDIAALGKAVVDYLNSLELPDSIALTQATASLRTLGVGAGTPTTGTAQFFVRAMFMQGATVASASNLSLGMDGNRFQVSGTTAIDRLSSTNWQAGSIVTLHLQGAITVNHNQAASGVNLPIMLDGSSNFVGAANDQLVVQLDSTASKWHEIARATAAGRSSMSYTPGSFAVATGTGRVMTKRLQLTGTQRATLAGTARLRIT